MGSTNAATVILHLHRANTNRSHANGTLVHRNVPNLRLPPTTAAMNGRAVILRLRHADTTLCRASGNRVPSGHQRQHPLPNTTTTIPHRNRRKLRPNLGAMSVGGISLARLTNHANIPLVPRNVHLQSQYAAYANGNLHATRLAHLATNLATGNHVRLAVLPRTHSRNPTGTPATNVNGNPLASHPRPRPRQIRTNHAYGILVPNIVPHHPRPHKSGTDKFKRHAMVKDHIKFVLHPSLLRLLPEPPRSGTDKFKHHAMVKDHTKSVLHPSLLHLLPESLKSGTDKFRLPSIALNQFYHALPESRKFGTVRSKHPHSHGTTDFSNARSQKTTRGRRWRCRSQLRPPQIRETRRLDGNENERQFV
jgi:hypothetical protein